MGGLSISSGFQESKYRASACLVLKLYIADGNTILGDRKFTTCRCQRLYIHKITAQLQTSALDKAYR